MDELKITVTIKLPDDKATAIKLFQLLRGASYHISNTARDEIAEMDKLANLLAEALPTPHPEKYKELIRNYRNVEHSWIVAREQAENAIGALAWHVHQAMQEEQD